MFSQVSVCPQGGSGYVSSKDHKVSLAVGRYVSIDGHQVSLAWVDMFKGALRVSPGVCPGVVYPEVEACPGAGVCTEGDGYYT